MHTIEGFLIALGACGVLGMATASLLINLVEKYARKFVFWK